MMRRTIGASAVWWMRAAVRGAQRGHRPSNEVIDAILSSLPGPAQLKPAVLVTALSAERLASQQPHHAPAVPTPKRVRKPRAMKAQPPRAPRQLA